MNPERKVLVTGATGFVGQVLLRMLPPSTHTIGRSKPIHPCTFFELDFNDSLDYATAFDGVEVVVHCAARVHIMNEESKNPLEEYRRLNTYATLHLAKQAAIKGVKRFIFISSVKVNGESTSGRSPFTADDNRAADDFYGQSKSEAEEQLLQLAKDTGLEVVIIRPPLVYGPGVKANFSALMNVVSKGIPLPFGCINTNKRSLVSVDNLVDLIVTCIEHPKAANQVFLVSDDHDVSTSEMVREMAKALGKRDWQIPVPLWCFKLLGQILNKEPIVGRLIGSLQVDISHTKETLNWHPPQTLEEGFRKTANAFLQSKNKEQ
ncbi:SDR family oxidoreductase [Vibrio sp. 404]|uniref:SDR family oxidoreductase n=1 Tax=Vibrio marinisediminis TaxID=2758441 RepID=A0A7W2ITS6_9VIBR|nr:SDR family oxidoreductase [Vibrio marinisediminis]MBA5762790.1 SDR family oxidoreductase [Vibrio marinisediminis]